MTRLRCAFPVLVILLALATRRGRADERYSPDGALDDAAPPVVALAIGGFEVVAVTAAVAFAVVPRRKRGGKR
jgi:hypothetical protein